MTVCILGNNLTALTLAKALVNNEIDVHILYNKKKSLVFKILIPVNISVNEIK